MIAVSKQRGSMRGPAGNGSVCPSPDPQLPIQAGPGAVPDPGQFPHPGAVPVPVFQDPFLCVLKRSLTHCEGPGRKGGRGGSEFTAPLLQGFLHTITDWIMLEKTSDRRVQPVADHCCVTQSRVLSATSSLSMNISRDSDSTTSLAAHSNI